MKGALVLFRPKQKKKWSELTAWQRILTVTLLVLQISLATAAWIDLSRRPPELVRGKKWWWGSTIGLNFFGPVAYFAFGRRTSQPSLVAGDSASAPALVE